jgi:SAM-dependent methyltransferase
MAIKTRPFLAHSPALEAAIEPWLCHMTWRQDFDQWRERRINQENYQHERLNLLERVVGKLDDLHLLDLGAGMGGFAVAAALQNANVVACEYNRAYCKIIALRAKRHHLSLPIFNAAGEHLPFLTHHFDAVISWDVIEHVQSPPQMLAEIARVLRPGGHAIVTVINRWAWNDPHYHLRGINWFPRWWAEGIVALRGRSKTGAAFRDMQRLSDMHYFSYHAFVALAQRSGFTVRDLREEALLEGTLPSPRRSRRLIRGVLHLAGLEHLAYQFERQWFMGMFELALCKMS